MACNNCRERKVKCDGVKPTCGYCRARSIDCSYINSRRYSRAKQDRRVLERLEQLEQIGDSWTVNQNAQDGSPIDRNSASSTQYRSERQSDTHQTLTPKSTTDETRSLSTILNLIQDGGLSSRAAGSDECQPGILSSAGLVQLDDEQTLLDELLREPGTRNIHDLGSSIIQIEEDSLYTGPSSGLSVLSSHIFSLASRAIREWSDSDLKLKLELCRATLLKIQQRMEKLLEMPSFLPEQPLNPLPSNEIVTKYVDVYFSTCQIIFPIVERSSFESTWRHNLKHPAAVDISWYMLQNAVLAVGAFTARSATTPASYQSAKEEALKYFNNALSVKGRVLQTRTGLTTIQALCVMSMFAQIIGHYNLGHMCTSLATQMAQSKGLHKTIADDLGLDAHHRTERKRIFWIIYFFDKSLALQIGRPSNIDDADISCSFPERTETGFDDFATSTELLLNFVRFAYICSKINKRLYSATALNKEPQQLMNIRNALRKDLDVWRDGLPEIYHVKRTPFRISSLPPYVKPVRAILFRIAYLYGLSTIYRRFSALFTGPSQTETDYVEAQKAQHEYLQASRDLILMLDQVEMEVDVPNGFIAYYLLTALVPLFIYVIANPFDESTKDDIALMNVATGIFGRLEFITSGDFAFEGVGEFAQLASAVIAKAKHQLEMGPVSMDVLDMADAGAFSFDGFSPSENFVTGNFGNFLDFSGMPMDPLMNPSV